MAFRDGYDQGALGASSSSGCSASAPASIQPPSVWMKCRLLTENSFPTAVRTPMVALIPAQPSLAAGIYAALTSGTSFSLTPVCGGGIPSHDCFQLGERVFKFLHGGEVGRASMRIMARLSRFARARPAAVRPLPAWERTAEDTSDGNPP